MGKRTATAIALICLLGAARAQSPQATDPPSFDKLDSNRDGYISKSEAEARRGLPELIRYYDRDGDNRLDRQEFERMLEDADRAARLGAALSSAH